MHRDRRLAGEPYGYGNAIALNCVVADKGEKKNNTLDLNYGDTLFKDIVSKTKELCPCEKK